MNRSTVTAEIIHEIMVLRSKGLMYAEIAAIVGRSTRTVEGVVVKNRHHWSREFNFPEITHAKRFGAK